LEDAQAKRLAVLQRRLLVHFHRLLLPGVDHDHCVRRPVAAWRVPEQHVVDISGNLRTITATPQPCEGATLKTAWKTAWDESVAYSYIRFSHPRQAEGDSLRRQTEAAADWCRRHGVRLDTATTLHDLGKSAYTGAHRKNPDRNALAGFLKLVEQGKVSRGSY